VSLLPVIAALLLHGWVLTRLPVAVLAVVALVVARALGWRPRPGRTALLLVLAVALGLELAGLLGPAPPPGAYPPRLLGSLCTLTGSLALISALAGREARSWAWAFALAGFSAVPVRGAFDLAGALAAAALLVALPFGIRAAPWRPARLGAFGAFLLLACVGSVGLAWAASCGEGLLLPVFERLAGKGLLTGSLGVGGSLRLTPLSNLPASDEPALALRGRPPRHLRTQVLDRFDGEAWSAGPSLAVRVPAPAAPDATLELLAYVHVREVTPAPLGLSEVNGHSAALDAAGLLRGGVEAGELLRMERAAERPLPGPAPDAAALAVPPALSAALAPFAARMVSPEQTPEAKAEAIEAWLLAHHSHSDRTDLRGDEHPLVVLLRDRPPASCSYLASAMALLLRVEGVPTRMVGGFLPWDHNPASGWTTVYKGDAHAWVEVWLPARGGWVAFDPTPVSLPPPPAGTAALWSALRRTLSRGLLRLRHRPAELLAASLRRPACIALAVLIIALWVVRRVGSRGPMRRSGSPAARALRDPALWPLYRRYQRSLRAAAPGPRPPGETDQDQLERLAPRLGPARHGAASAFLEAYQAARYGDGHIRLVRRRLRALRA
jgi:transglutaminase-like putative cysteine protease